MAESSISITEGSGKRFHGWDWSIQALSVLDAFQLPGEVPAPSYVLGLYYVPSAAGDAGIQIMAPPNKAVRVHRIYMDQRGNYAADNTCSFTILRLTNAGSLGTGPEHAGPLQEADGDTGSAIQYQIASGTSGTESTVIFSGNLSFRSAYLGNRHDEWEWRRPPGSKPLTIPPGVANGLEIKVLTNFAAVAINVRIEYTEGAV